MNRLHGVLGAVVIAFLPIFAHAACASKSSAPMDVVMAQHVAFNAHDLDAFLACYATNVVIAAPSWKPPSIVGIAAMRMAYAKGFKGIFHSEYLSMIVSGPVVVVLERLTGGRRNNSRQSVAMFEVRDGKIVHVWFPPYK